MLDALVTGTTDPEVLAELARGQLRKKLPALREALVGRFDPAHALIVGRILAHLYYLDEAIDELSEAIAEQIRPFARERDLLTTIPDIGQRAAEVLIAEIGTDMTAFSSAKHLASGIVAAADPAVSRQPPAASRQPPAASRQPPAAGQRPVAT